MPAVYDDIGLKFLYPENWSVTDEETEDWPRTVSVQAPGGSFFTVHVYPPRSDRYKLMEEVIDAIRKEFQEIEVLDAAEQISECPTLGFDLAFFYLDLLIEARIRSLETPSATLIWLYQAESRDFDEHEGVFQAICKSMLDNQVARP